MQMWQKISCIKREEQWEHKEREDKLQKLLIATHITTKSVQTYKNPRADLKID